MITSILQQLTTSKVFVGGSKSTLNQIYAFLGKTSQPVNGSPASLDSILDGIFLAKKVTEADLVFVIANTNWVSGTVYKGYNAITVVSSSIVITPIGDHFSFYKCIYSPGTPSTVKPSTETLYNFETVDGYVWKFLSAVTSDTYNKFATNQYVPFIANTAVEASAIPNTIDHVAVNDGGSNYTNWYEGTFRSQDITSSNVVFTLQETSSSSNGVYSNCVIKVVSGTSSGQSRVISSFVANNSSRVITTLTPFNPRPVAGDEYVISPRVSGGSFVGRAIIAANSVLSVEVIDRGVNNAANTVLTITTPVSAVAAVLEPSISPRYGHGGNQIEEVHPIGIQVTTGFNDLLFPAGNQFNVVGLIEGVRVDNVVLNLTTTNGDLYTQGESLFEYKHLGSWGRADGAGNTLTTTSSTNYYDFKVDDYVKVSNTTVITIGQIVNINTSNTVTLSVNVQGYSNAALIKVTKIGDAIVARSNTSTLEINNATATFGSYLQTADRIYGTTSKTDNIVASNQAQGATSSFDTIINTSIITGNATGTFVVGEKVGGGTLEGFTANSNQLRLFVTGPSSDLAVGNVVVGLTSNAHLTINAKYEKLLANNQFSIMCSTATSNTTRNADSTQTIRTIVEL